MEKISLGVMGGTNRRGAVIGDCATVARLLGTVAALFLAVFGLFRWLKGGQR